MTGELVDNWKKRFIVLEDGLVTSYTEDPRTQPNLRPTKDTIDLMAGCQIVSIADDPAGEYATKIVWPKGSWPQTSFVVIAAKHTYYLYADAEDEAAYVAPIYVIACRLTRAVSGSSFSARSLPLGRFPSVSALRSAQATRLPLAGLPSSPRCGILAMSSSTRPS